jgi:hypothetical protein
MSCFTKRDIRRTVGNLPKTVDEAYGRILDRCPGKDKARRLLHVVSAAERPLSLQELSLAMAFSAGHRSISDILDELETDDKRSKKSIRDLCGLVLFLVGGKVLASPNYKGVLTNSEAAVSLAVRSYDIEAREDFLMSMNVLPFRVRTKLFVESKLLI